MITFITLSLIALLILIVAMIVAVVLSPIIGIIVLIVGDLMVCGLLIVAIFKSIFKKKGK